MRGPPSMVHANLKWHPSQNAPNKRYDYRREMLASEKEPSGIQAIKQIITTAGNARLFFTEMDSKPRCNRVESKKCAVIFPKNARDGIRLREKIPQAKRPPRAARLAPAPMLPRVGKSEPERDVFPFRISCGYFGSGVLGALPEDSHKRCLSTARLGIVAFGGRAL